MRDYSPVVCSKVSFKSTAERRARRTELGRNRQLRPPVEVKSRMQRSPGACIACICGATTKRLLRSDHLGMMGSATHQHALGVSHFGTPGVRHLHIPTGRGSYASCASWSTSAPFSSQSSPLPVSPPPFGGSLNPPTLGAFNAPCVPCASDGAYAHVADEEESDSRAVARSLGGLSGNLSAQHNT